jgi:hypothetical protein
MAEWLVRLLGSEWDLQWLPRFVRSANWTVSEQEGSYCLKSPYFNALVEAKEVEIRAQEVLDRINGLAKIHIDGFRSVTIGALTLAHPDGGRDHFATMSVRARITVDVAKDDAADSSAQIEAWASCIEFAAEDERIAKVLRIFGCREMDWRELYNVLEVIADDAGHEIDNWASKNAIRNFKHTACSPTALGDDARHGTEATLPPRRPPSLAEADSFIRDIAIKWLRWKRDAKAGKGTGS